MLTLEDKYIVNSNLSELFNILNCYIEVHDSISKISIWRLFSRIDYKSYADKLVSILSELDVVMQTIASSPPFNNSPAIEYSAALAETIRKLHTICDRLHDKTQNRSYSMSEYNQDFAAYNRLVQNYSHSGRHLSDWRLRMMIS